jgi:mono/diheme cytochrome c family protein
MVKLLLYFFLLTILVGIFSEDIKPAFIEHPKTGFIVSGQTNTIQTETIAGGKELFMKYCLSCHQTDGSGVPNTYPPLRKSNWVNGDKFRLIKILLNGLQGEIEVNDDFYDQVMPKQITLSDEQIAIVLTYIRQNFGNDTTTVSTAEVAEVRGKNQ